MADARVATTPFQFLFHDCGDSRRKPRSSSSRSATEDDESGVMAGSVEINRTRATQRRSVRASA